MILLNQDLNYDNTHALKYTAKRNYDWAPS